MCSSKIVDFQIFNQFFFSPGPWPLRRPPEAANSTSATSIGYQILEKYVSFHMRYFLLIWNKNEDGLDYVFQNGQNPHPPTPPRVFNCPKSPQDLGLNVDTLNTSNSLIPFFLSFQRWHFPLRKVRLQYSWPKHMTHRFFSHPYMSTAFHSSFDGIYFSHLYSKSLYSSL